MGGVAAMLLLTSCEYRWGWRDHDQVIEPLNMRFHIRRNDSTNVISFGAADAEKLDNYIEVYQPRDLDKSFIYFFIDNSTGSMKVNNSIILNYQHFLEYHFEDFNHKVYIHTWEPDSIRVSSMEKYIDKLSPVNADSILPHSYLLLEAIEAPFSRGINYKVYDLGKVDDFDYFISSLSETDLYMRFSDMKSNDDLPINYADALSQFGQPEIIERTKVSNDNRKLLIQSGWLFLDTIGKYHDATIEKCKWNIENADKYLTIFYLIGEDSLRTPINGALYRKSIDTLFEHIWLYSTGVFYE